MRRVHDRTGLTALTAVPALGRQRVERDARPKGRAPLLELLVVGALVMLVVSMLILSARSQVNAEQAQVSLSLSSDPSGASVIVDNLWVGTTPLELEMTRAQEVSLRVEAREPYLEYHLYKPYRTQLTLDGDRNLHVWIPRTTAAEQAAELAGNR